MNDNLSSNRTAAPWSFWVISAISLLWNGFGGYDYTMTRMRNADYLGAMGNATDILVWIDSFPMWVQVLWPVGVWASVLGAVSLLFRSRHAVTAFMFSLVGAIGSFIGQMMVAVPASLDTTMNKVLPAFIVVGILFFWWYSRRQVAAGVLR